MDRAGRVVAAHGAVAAQPVPRDPRRPGRNRIPDRQVLCGILFVLHTGIQWEFLPQELGFGSGMTC
ncbi:transposase [Phytohabitans kaempferiae]|uniref:Transposase n=1 Tax=Phytohabitans kaempferiae TaxID=1620943 RepID=A0ABV6M366_9ACTN